MKVCVTSSSHFYFTSGCSRCTLVWGNTYSHEWGDYLSKSASQHQARCACGQTTLLSHSMKYTNTASGCKYHCSQCNYVHSTIAHSLGDWQMSNNYHWKNCTRCGGQFEYGACKWVFGYCSVCGKWSHTPGVDDVITPVGLLTVEGDDNHRLVGALKPPESLLHSTDCDDGSCENNQNQVGLCGSENCQEENCTGDSCTESSSANASCTSDCEAETTSTTTFTSPDGWTGKIVNESTPEETFVLEPANEIEDKTFEDDSLNKAVKFTVKMVVLDSAENTAKNNDEDDSTED